MSKSKMSLKALKEKHSQAWQAVRSRMAEKKALVDQHQLIAKSVKDDEAAIQKQLKEKTKHLKALERKLRKATQREQEAMKRAARGEWSSEQVMAAVSQIETERKEHEALSAALQDMQAQLAQRQQAYALSSQEMEKQSQEYERLALEAQDLEAKTLSIEEALKECRENPYCTTEAVEVIIKHYDRLRVKDAEHHHAQMVQLEQQLALVPKSEKMESDALRQAKSDLRAMVKAYASLKRELEASSEENITLTSRLSAVEQELSLHGSEMNQVIMRERELQRKLEQCVYPSDKFALQQQLKLHMEREEKLKQVFEEVTREHVSLKERLAQTTQQNQDLKVILQKYDTNLRAMEGAVAKSAELQGELNRAMKVKRKQEDQMQLLQQQLTVLAEVNHKLKAEQEALSNQLSHSSSPEETDALQEKLISCRSKSKESMLKADSLVQTLHRLEKQRQEDEVRIQSLVNLLKDYELTRQKVHDEVKIREQLQGALSQCENKKDVDVDVLRSQLAEVQKRYENEIRQHQSNMDDATRRLEALKQQNQQSVKDLERVERSPDGVMPGPTWKRLNELEQKIDQAIAQSKADRESFAKRLPLEIQASHALKVQQLPGHEALLRIQGEHMQGMHEQEKEIMRIQYETLQKLYSAIANKSTNGSTLEDIKRRGQEREQAAMKDMLTMRALAERLNQEMAQMKSLQASILDQARSSTRSQAKSLIDDQANLMQWRPAMSQMDVLNQAQKQMLESERLQTLRQLEGQKSYVDQLQTQLPLMNQLVKTMEQVPTPDMKPLIDYFGKTRDVTSEALSNEQAKLTGLTRATGGLESQLDAVLAQTSRLRSIIPKLATDKLPDYADSALAALEDPSKWSAEFTKNHLMRDNAPIRLFVIDPQATTKAMTSGTMKDRLTGRDMNPSGILKEPQVGAQLTSVRASSALSQGYDLVVISYTFSKPDSALLTVKDDKLMEATLKQLADDLNQMGNDLSVQVVSVYADGKRFDRVGNKYLQPQCTYKQCNPATINMAKATLADQIRGVFKGEEKEASQSIVSIKSANSTSTIHLVSMIFPMDSISGPSLQSLNLINQNWITFLQDILQDKNTKMDVFANLLPDEPAAGDYNGWMKEVSRQLNEILSKRLK